MGDVSEKKAPFESLGLGVRVLLREMRRICSGLGQKGIEKSGIG